MPAGHAPHIRDDREVRAATAQLLHGLLGLIEAGEIDASSAHAKRMVRRIEGAATALTADLERKRWFRFSLNMPDGQNVRR